MSTTAAPARANSPGPLAWFGRFLWRELNSLPTAIWVMVALAILNAVGTIVPQSHLAQPPMGMSWDDFLAGKYGPIRFKLIHMMGFDHVYFTWYFNALLVWLCVSAVVCNIVRYRTTLRLWQAPPATRGRSFFTNHKRAVFYDLPEGGDDAALKKVEDDFRQHGYRVVRGEQDGAQCLYADKGFLRKWALVLLHIAVLVLLFGGIYGKATGSQGNARLADNSTDTLVLNRWEKKVKYIQPLLKLLPPLTYELDQRNFRIDYDWKIEVPSEMKANTAPELWPYYRYQVRDYVSTLTAKFKGRTKQREVKVNHPLVIEKLILYQSGYEQNGFLKIQWSAQDGGTQESRILPDQECALTPLGMAILDESSGQWLLPPDEGDSFQVVPESVGFSPFHYKFEAVKSGDLYEAGKPKGRIGPLTIVSIYDASTGSEQYLGSQIIDTEHGFDGFVGNHEAHITMSERINNYSIFSYNRDPGKPVLYFGWICMIVGTALTLYIGFSQLWLRVEGGRVFVLTMGPLARSTYGMRRRLHAILSGK